MSNIFDALQRSEADHSGFDSPGQPELTELLRRVEARAVSRWTVAPESAQLDRETAGDAPLSAASSVTPADVAIKATVAAEPVTAGEQMDIVGQFRTIPTVIPPDSRLVCLTDKESAAAESFRLLGLRLRHHRRSLKKVLITSTIPQEGKSMIAANLACVLAEETRQRVLLVEGDVRRPVLSTTFGIDNPPGLCEWLRGERSLSTSIYHLERPGLWIFPAGSAANNPLEFLQSGKLSMLMNQLMEWFGWIIIDSPPVLPVADTSVWSRLADGILLVTRRGTTEKQQLEKGLEAIEPSKLIGAVLNSSTPLPHSNYYYGRPADSFAADRDTE